MTGEFRVRATTTRWRVVVLVSLLPRPAEPVDDGFTYSVQAQFSKGWSTGIIPLISKAGVEGGDDLPAGRSVIPVHG